MAGTVTLTGTSGPALTVAAVQFTEVQSVTIDMVTNMITVFKGGQTVSPINVNAATTVTATKSGSTWTLTVA